MATLIYSATLIVLGYFWAFEDFGPKESFQKVENTAAIMDVSSMSIFNVSVSYSKHGFF